MTEEPHTDFEIAIERELHNALDQAGAIALAEHLVGCASCRGYQQTAMEMETNMEAAGNLFSLGVVWGRVKTVVDERVGEERAGLRRVAFATVSAGVAAFVYFVCVRHRLPELGMMALLLAAYVAGRLYLMWRGVRGLEQRAKDAQSSSEELFAVLDSANRRHTTQTWLGIALLPVLGSVFVPRILQGPPNWLFISCVIVGFIAAVAESAQRLVRLRRERAAFLR